MQEEKSVIELWMVYNGFAYDGRFSLYEPRKFYFEEVSGLDYKLIYKGKNYNYKLGSNVFETEADCAVACASANEYELNRFNFVFGVKKQLINGILDRAVKEMKRENAGKTV